MSISSKQSSRMIRFWSGLVFWNLWSIDFSTSDVYIVLSDYSKSFEKNWSYSLKSWSWVDLFFKSSITSPQASSIIWVGHSRNTWSGLNLSLIPKDGSVSNVLTNCDFPDPEDAVMRRRNDSKSLNISAFDG